MAFILDLLAICSPTPTILGVHTHIYKKEVTNFPWLMTQQFTTPNGKVIAPSRLLFRCNLSSYSPLSALINKIFSILELIHASVLAEGRYLIDFALFFILNGSLSNHWYLLDWIDKSWSRLIERSFSLFFFLKWIFHHRYFKEMRKKRRILESEGRTEDLKRVVKL